MGYGPRQTPFLIRKVGSGWTVAIDADNLLLAQKAHKTGWRGEMVIVGTAPKGGPTKLDIVPSSTGAKPFRFKTKGDAEHIVHRIARYKFGLGDFVDNYTTVVS